MDLWWAVPTAEFVSSQDQQSTSRTATSSSFEQAASSQSTDSDRPDSDLLLAMLEMTGEEGGRSVLQVEWTETNG